MLAYALRMPAQSEQFTMSPRFRSRNPVIGNTGSVCGPSYDVYADAPDSMS